MIFETIIFMIKALFLVFALVTSAIVIVCGIASIFSMSIFEVINLAVGWLACSLVIVVVISFIEWLFDRKEDK